MIPTIFFFLIIYFYIIFINVYIFYFSSDDESIANTKPEPQIDVLEPKHQLDPGVIKMEIDSKNKVRQILSYEVEKIIDMREKMGKIEYLIQWKEFSMKDDTWEPKNSLTENCSDLLAEFGKEWEREYNKYLENKPVSKFRRYGKRRRFSSASTLSPPRSD